MEYSVHFEPETDYRHPDERPIAWVVRVYEGNDAERQYAALMPYACSFTLHRSCLNIAEAKGLSDPKVFTLQIFRAIMRALPRIGIDIMEVKHKHRRNFYETKNFIKDG